MNQTVQIPVRFDAFSYIEKAIRTIIRFFDRHYMEVRITATAEDGSSVRVVTIQATNRNNEEAVGHRYAVQVVIGDSDDATPGGTQTVTVTTGGGIAILAANQVVWLTTDLDGLIELEISVVGAGSRWVSVVAGDKVFTSEELTWV